jgi:hypothetical protein
MATKSLYDKLRDGMTAKSHTLASRKWFADKVKLLNGNINAMTMLKDPHLQQRTTFRPGFMYQYIYDAQGKDELPYWDKFPLMIAIGPAPGGFYGLNMHYLHPTIRARFLDKLLSTVNNDKYDETTKFKLNYQMLSTVGRMAPFKPCWKHYLFKQVKSRIMLVPSSEWEIAIFLPTEKFIGENKTTVWRKSNKIITSG